MCDGSKRCRVLHEIQREENGSGAISNSDDCQGRNGEMSANLKNNNVDMYSKQKRKKKKSGWEKEEASLGFDRWFPLMSESATAL